MDMDLQSDMLQYYAAHNDEEDEFASPDESVGEIVTPVELAAAADDENEVTPEQQRRLHESDRELEALKQQRDGLLAMIEEQKRSMEDSVAAVDAIMQRPAPDDGTDTDTGIASITESDSPQQRLEVLASTQQSQHDETEEQLLALREKRNSLRQMLEQQRVLRDELAQKATARFGEGQVNAMTKTNPALERVRSHEPELPKSVPAQQNGFATSNVPNQPAFTPQQHATSQHDSTPPRPASADPDSNVNAQHILTAKQRQLSALLNQLQSLKQLTNHATSQASEIEQQNGQLEAELQQTRAAGAGTAVELNETEQQLLDRVMAWKDRQSRVNTLAGELSALRQQSIQSRSQTNSVLQQSMESPCQTLPAATLNQTQNTADPLLLGNAAASQAGVDDDDLYNNNSDQENTTRSSGGLNNSFSLPNMSQGQHKSRRREPMSQSVDSGSAAAANTTPSSMRSSTANASTIGGSDAASVTEAAAIYERKLAELSDARNRLSSLQELMSRMQQHPETSSPADLAQLTTLLEELDRESQAGSPVPVENPADAAAIANQQARIRQLCDDNARLISMRNEMLNMARIQEQQVSPAQGVPRPRSRVSQSPRHHHSIPEQDEGPRQRGQRQRYSNSPQPATMPDRCKPGSSRVQRLQQNDYESDNFSATEDELVNIDSQAPSINGRYETQARRPSVNVDPPTPPNMQSAPGSRLSMGYGDRRGSSTNLQVQYAQLQQHMNSIRDIFQQVVTDVQALPVPGMPQQGMMPGYGMQQGMMPGLPQMGLPHMGAMGRSLTPTPSMLGGNDAGLCHSNSACNVAAMQQFNAMQQLAAMQQQMQMQQLEMQQLRSMCHGLASRGASPAPESRRGSILQPSMPYSPGPMLQSPGFFAPNYSNLLSPMPGMQPDMQQQFNNYQQPVSSLNNSRETLVNRHKSPSRSENLNVFYTNNDLHQPNTQRSTPSASSMDRAAKKFNNARLNSPPTSVPNSVDSTPTHRGSGGSSELDGVRDMIYSEVATLISQNENRPEYLVDLFRELQLLSSDHLRSRALDAIRDLLNRFLTRGHRDSDVDEASRQVLQSLAQRLDQASLDDQPTPVQSPRQLASPPSGTLGPRQTSLRSSIPRATRQSAPTVPALLQTPTQQGTRRAVPQTATLSPLPLDGRRSRSRSQSRAASPSRDIAALRATVAEIVAEVEPFTRDNGKAVCSPAMLGHIKQMILALSVDKFGGLSDGKPAEAFDDFYHRQLASILEDTLARFQSQKLGVCRGELLKEVSEVVFNELAFFRVMNNASTAGVETRRTSTSRAASSREPSVATGGLMRADSAQSSRSGSVSVSVSIPMISNRSLAAPQLEVTAPSTDEDRSTRSRSSSHTASSNRQESTTSNRPGVSESTTTNLPTSGDSIPVVVMEPVKSSESRETTPPDDDDLPMDSDKSE